MAGKDPVGEGVIQFQSHHVFQSLSALRYREVVCRLIAWREILSGTELIGQDPARYEGLGYGNVSARAGAPSAPRGRRPFLITGTQTSGKRSVGLSDFVLVSRCEPHLNTVHSMGEIEPSSESMTHGAIYDLSSHIRFVFHVHCPVIWRQSEGLKIPQTRSDVGYGTQEMALEVQKLYQSTRLQEMQILTMGGHEDGVISFGRSAEEAGQVLIRWLAKAYESVCMSGHRSDC